MGWIEDNKGKGPWPFAPQYNKWGYLNNPTWMNPAIPTEISYNTGGEPQIWTPDRPIHDLDSTTKHWPCGHWHKLVSTPPPATIPPIATYLPWWSCPQTVCYGNDTDDIFFITTDNGDPSILYVIRYNRISDNWTTIYTDSEISANMWFEPPISRSTYGTIMSFGMCKPVGDGSVNGLEIFTFDGETNINAVLILPEVGKLLIMPTEASHFLTIDGNGTIHVIRGDFTSGLGNTTYYDCRSFDNGATFSEVPIVTAFGFSYSQFIVAGTGSTMWALIHGHRLYKSTNGGDTWTYISTPPVVPYDFAWLNGALYIVSLNGSAAKIYRSTDGTTWVQVLGFTRSYPRNGTITYDGTYYYAIFNHRDAAGNVAGTNRVYRSDDGLSWVQISTFADNSELGSTNMVTSDISVYSGKVVYTYYYASTLLSGYLDTYMLTVWESSDSGVTWIPIQTPFYDLSTGVPPT